MDFIGLNMLRLLMVRFQTTNLISIGLKNTILWWLIFRAQKFCRWHFCHVFDRIWLKWYHSFTSKPILEVWWEDLMEDTLLHQYSVTARALIVSNVIPTGLNDSDKLVVYLIYLAKHVIWTEKNWVKYETKTVFQFETHQPIQSTHWDSKI